MDLTVNNESENETTTRRPSMTDFITHYYLRSNVGVLENTRVKIYDSNSMVRPLEYGFVNSAYKNRNKRPVATFDWLPEELILHLFKVLDKYTLTKCALVCKQWQRIAYDESLWQCLNIPLSCMNVMTLDHLLRRKIKFLSIAYGHIKHTEYSFETPLITLQHLDMSSVFVTVENLCSLLSQCCNLVKLSLKGCIINAMCCKHIGDNTNLKVLNLSYTVGLTCTGINYIVSLKNLEELSLSWAHLDADDLHYLTHRLMSSIKRLDISGFLKKLKDMDFLSVFCRCPELIQLDISDNSVITLNILHHINNQKLKLKVLSVNRSYNIITTLLTSSSLWMLIKNIVPELEELNMFGIDNQHSAIHSIFKFSINKNKYTFIARLKLADNEIFI